nr:uncharacterized protein K02A2.6-like [Aedes albopictus]
MIRSVYLPNQPVRSGQDRAIRFMEPPVINDLQPGISETLQTFLQVYRTTPSRVLNGRTPSQQMLGRNIKTVLDLLHDDQPKSVVRNHRKDEQFNRKHGAVPRDFKKGEDVYAKVYTSNTKWQWVSGLIIEVIGRVNHNCSWTTGIDGRSSSEVTPTNSNFVPVKRLPLKKIRHR